MGATPVTLGLPVVGRLTYGGVEFEELLKSKMSGRVEWDSARRTVKFVRYKLEVDGYVVSTNGSPNDPKWSQLRYALQQPGLALTYSDRGFANFNVNVDMDNGLVDVCDGPHPEVLDFTPMGARLAAHIIWRCEICIPEIRAGTSRDEAVSGRFQSPFSRGILAFNWETELNFHDDGYASYSVRGELEIARVRGRPDNLENYRAYTEPQLPATFKPTRRSFKADAAKRLIKFDYGFEELPPMGLPVRCTKAGGNYRVNCNKGPALVNWSATLRATYTVVPTGPRREAYLRFLGLLRDRIDAVTTASVPTVVGGGVAPVPTGVAGIPGGGGNLIGGALQSLSSLFQATTGVGRRPTASNSRPIIRTFTIDEGLYEDSKTTTFECSWTFITTFASIFVASGAWRKMADCAGQLKDNRDVWVTDMASIVGYTSWYDYGFRPNAEVIVSPNILRRGPITAGQKVVLTGATANDNERITAGAGLVREGVDPDSGAQPDADVQLPGLPSPETSWLNYEIDFITELDPGIALHKPLPQRDDPVDTLGTVDPYDQRPEIEDKLGVNTRSRSSAQDILQRMATSTYRVAMRGFGVRAGYKVPVPDLKVFGGSTVSPSKQRVIGPKIVANYSGVPVYMTAWLLWYDVPTPPRAPQAALPNLAQHIGDVAAPPEFIKVPVSVPEPQPPISRFNQ